jgi:hypothetical protein
VPHVSLRWLSLSVGRYTIAAILAVVLLSAAALRAEQQLLFDFERQGLSSDWSAMGKISAARRPVPESSAQGEVVPAGHGAYMKAGANGAFFSKQGKVPGDWRRFESVSLWVHRSPEEAQLHPVSTIDLRVYENDGRTRFWRKVELKHTGWAEISLPLKWFRFGDNRIPRWDRVGRCAIRFRDAAEITVDGVSLTVGTVERASELNVADLAEMAFPDTPAGEVRVLKNDDMRLLTNAEKLDLEKLAVHLARVAERVRSDLPLVDDPAVPATLIVFATTEQYRAFHARFLRRLNSEGAVTSAQGYTVHGVATSAWDERQGTLRPVYTHEFVHSLVAHGTAIQNRSHEWFQEGLANYYQLQFHPQASFSEIVKQGLDRESHQLPLPSLLSGRPIPNKRYWQAVTVVHMLLNDEAYKTRLPALIEAFQESGSTNIAPHLESVLKTTEEGFARRWQAYCRSKYAG